MSSISFISSVSTGKIIEKLERVVEFRTGCERTDYHYPIVVGKNNPATDGTKIFMPARENHFKKERDNELFLADVTAHEADHIKELNEYFGEEAGGLRESGKTSLVQEYFERNHSELTENPALAGWIDNIVKDRRIDAQRRKQLPGVERHYKEVIEPAAEYFRPSIRGLSELDAFREQYLQKALFGRTIEGVSEKHKALLEEVVSLTESAESIHTDKETVAKIYGRFKENFDITQPISKLPPMFGTGNDEANSGNPSQSYGQGNGKGKDGKEKDDKKDGKGGDKDKDEKPNSRGYGKEIKPRQGRDKNDKKPGALADDKGSGENKNQNKKENGKLKNNDSEEKNNYHIYKNGEEKYGIKIFNIEPQRNSHTLNFCENFRNRYAGEIESMKRIFRQLRLRDYGDRRDFQGQELDYEDYLQADLESKVTGIKSHGKCFKEKTQNRQRPVFGIHADVSGSTRGEIIEAIKASFYIMGNALSASDYNYALYSSADHLGIIKSPVEKWNEDINLKIAGLNAGGEGIYLEATSSVIADDLRRADGNPKGLIIISDFEVCGTKEKESAIVKKLYEQKIFPFLITIGKEHEENARELTREIGNEYYSVIPVDRLYELPGEMFRLFKTFGIAR